MRAAFKPGSQQALQRARPGRIAQAPPLSLLQPQPQAPPAGPRCTHAHLSRPLLCPRTAAAAYVKWGSADRQDFSNVADNAPLAAELWLRSLLPSGGGADGGAAGGSGGSGGAAAEGGAAADGASSGSKAKEE